MPLLYSDPGAIDTLCRPSPVRRKFVPFQTIQKADKAQLRQQARHPCALPEAETADTTAEEELQLEGISSQYCDDFVCTSSPQVNSIRV